MTPRTIARRHRVVIIGSGFGGLFAAKEFADKDVDVTLIAKTSLHTFQPLLYQVATGILSEGEIAPATRVILRHQKNVRVIIGAVRDIDLKKEEVTSIAFGQATTTPYDSLIVATGANQSYFGNNHFAEFAPGMKTIDDALEIRSRILGAFDHAELTDDPIERERLLTFVVIGAGPTGVETAGQLAEMANRTLNGAYRHINSADARVLLVEGADQVLPPFGPRLGKKAKAALEELGVEVHLNTFVTDVTATKVTVKKKDGALRDIPCDCKIWSAGISANSLAALLASQSGAKVDRAGRILINKDLTVPGFPNAFAVGDMVNLDNLPAVAQVAMQGGEYAAKQILRDVSKGEITTHRTPFRYRDYGSMATIRQFSAVAKMGKLEFTGFVGWAMWLFIHLMYLVGFKNRFTAFFAWGVNVMTNHRGQLTSTAQQSYARMAIQELRRIEPESDFIPSSKIRAEIERRRDKR